MKLLRRAEEWIAIAMFVILFFILLLQVVSRFVLADPFFWTEELARYLFIWVVLIGSSEAIRTRTHIGMELVPNLLGERHRMLLGIVMDLLVLGCLVALTYHGAAYARRANAVDSVVLEVPESLLYGALPVGAALMSLRLILRLVRDVAQFRSHGRLPVTVEKPVRESAI
jgi:TRAP-type C4-dicarboxylate transport system permease small subunit